MARPTGRWFGAVLSLVVLSTIPLVGGADARTDRLVDLLRTSGNYRIRVQSAQSLGRIREPRTVPALISALDDEHPAVRAAAAGALGRIGDQRAIEPLRALAGRTDQPPSVVRQAERSIEQIEQILSSSGSSGATPTKEVRFYIGVGEMGNTTGEREGEVEKVLASLISDELERSEGIKLAPPNEPPRQTGRILKKNRRWKGYFIQGSVNRLEVVGGNVSASVSLMILSNPGRDLRMMLSGRGGAGIPGREKLSPSQARSLQDLALRAAVEGAIQRLVKQLHSRP